ncbi:ribosome-recycling factor, chloroplastic isoform X2 [Rhodamnia argentea]|uniref:Ribosome-recycling factor, chloroplastic n=1 Tax=Rhodamnia argentea TaxID=178133 RepID=A0A8B8R0B4_9MYRT|nr:ribosome-recycling factor, chloroplastic isoform X2 [Rhodamnia argentea]
MASPFSHTPPVRSILQPKPNPPRTLLALRDSYRGWSDSSGCGSCSAAVGSLRAAASYVSIRSGAAKLCCQRRVGERGLLQGRAGVVKCATTEEIEAEKSTIEKDVKQRMEKTIETLRSKFNSVRTGRANPAMLDKVEVEYYGSPVSLKSIAQISTPEASSLLVQPYDKSSLKAIEKAIVSSDLGMTPNNDGEVIRLSLPQLTTERRKELSKVVAKQAEEGKVALRNIRRDALKAYEKLEKFHIASTSDRRKNFQKTM